MIEGTPSPIEKDPEHIPSLEEVHSIFKKLTNKEWTETQKFEDDKGLCRLDMTVPGDAPGEVVEYNYVRKGRFKEAHAESSTTEIHVTTYSDGMPTGGTSAARLIDGVWKIFE